MINRIRYKYTSSDTNSQLVSQQQYAVAGHQYQIHIDTLSSSFTIVDNSNNTTAKEGNGKSLHGVKMAAKNALKSLGVVFDEETRKQPKQVTVDPLLG